MPMLQNIRDQLKQMQKSDKKAIFFKVEPGHYAEHDQFIDVSVPDLRKTAKLFYNLSLKDIQSLLGSKINEERLLALFILVDQYQKGEVQIKNQIYQFYIDHLKNVNNWNLVDSSAHLILGCHLIDREKDILITLANSSVLWERRIAIIATLYFIRENHFEWTLKIAKILLNDTQDLIHKATGWMLREVGKRDKTILSLFLNKYHKEMPRTMLRYAIEKFTAEGRDKFLKLTKKS